eukprot:10038055-Prorocentrum_lima.AAC.1
MGEWAKSFLRHIAPTDAVQRQSAMTDIHNRIANTLQYQNADMVHRSMYPEPPIPPTKPPEPELLRQ